MSKLNPMSTMKEPVPISEYARRHAITPCRVRVWIDQERLQAKTWYGRWIVEGGAPRPTKLGRYELNGRR
jgi:hypothetical protein